MLTALFFNTYSSINKSGTVNTANVTQVFPSGM